jgi:hypothetical protein
MLHDNVSGKRLQPVRRRRPRATPEVEDIDPLSLIEIKSAIQWKEMSKRISFSFDQVSIWSTCFGAYYLLEVFIQMLH